MNKSTSLRHVYLAATSVLVLAGSGAGQAAAAQQLAANELDAVIVTGARGTARTVASSPAPIDVLSEDTVEKAIKANVLESLNTLLPSYNLPNVATPNVGSMVRAGQLRGLNPDQTLVLINGRRKNATAFLGAGGFSASAPVDLSLIPSGAIKRIEVLRDGASAIYGSDAIAGVINIITDDSAEGGEISVRAGQFYEGDGLTRVFKASQGFRLGDAGHLRLSGQVDDQEIVIRNSPVNPNLLYYFPISNTTGREVTPAGTLNSNPSLPAGASPNPREATRDNNAWKNTGKAPFRLESLSADFGYALNPSVEAYAFATYAHRTSDAPQNFRTPNRDEVVRAIYPDGFTPVEAIDEVDYSIIGGLRGDNLFGWRWDLGFAYGKDDIDVSVYNSINPTYGLNSQTSFYIGNLQYAARTINLDLNRSIAGLPFPVDVSVGVEHRYEKYDLSAGDVQSYTHGGARVLDGPRAGTVLGASLGVSQALPGFRPDDEQHTDRTNTSIYAGVTLRPLPAWSIDLAARAEDYSDFGRTQTGRISSRYEFTPALAIRGTASTGFKAPALAAQAYKNTGNANTSTNHVLQVGSPEAIALGAKPLEPETSVNYSVGVVARPWGVNVALDAYQISIKDRIAQSTQFNNTTYPGSGVLVAAAGFAPADGISYFVNAVDTRTRGIELTLEKTTDFDRFGSIRWSYAANWNKVDITDIAPTPAVLAAFNIPVFSAASQVNLKAQSPKSKHIFGANWTKGRWNVDLRETYYGDLSRTGTPNPVPTSGPYAGQTTIFYDIGGLWITDLNVTVDVTEKLQVTLSGSNLFDTKPDQLPTALLGAHQIYSYTNNGPIGPEGGFYSASVRYRF